MLWGGRRGEGAGRSPPSETPTASPRFSDDTRPDSPPERAPGTPAWRGPRGQRDETEQQNRAGTPSEAHLRSVGAPWSELDFSKQRRTCGQERLRGTPGPGYRVQSPCPPGPGAVGFSMAGGWAAGSEGGCGGWSQTTRVSEPGLAGQTGARHAVSGPGLFSQVWPLSPLPVPQAGKALRGDGTTGHLRAQVGPPSCEAVGRSRELSTTASHARPHPGTRPRPSVENSGTATAAKAISFRGSGLASSRLCVPEAAVCMYL